jgi:hypothetical protein
MHLDGEIGDVKFPDGYASGIFQKICELVSYRMHSERLGTLISEDVIWAKGAVLSSKRDLLISQ